MGEDIKILEELNEHLKQQPLNCDVYIREDDRTALENLLKRYKELEKENEILNGLDKSHSKQIAMMSERHFKDREKIKNSIPISYIKEKINEYLEFDKEHKIYTKDGRENFTFEYFKAVTLKELLKEGGTTNEKN